MDSLQSFTLLLALDEAFARGDEHEVHRVCFDSSWKCQARTPLIVGSLCAQGDLARGYRDTWGRTLLYDFVGSCYATACDPDEAVEVCRVLVDAGVDVNDSGGGGDLGEPVLHRAVVMGRKEIVEFLVKRAGADVNLKDRVRRRTALHRLARLGRNRVAPGYHDENHSGYIVDLLVSRGADLEAWNYERETPLDVACYSRNAPVLSLLLRSGARLVAPYYLHLCLGYEECREVFLKHFARLKFEGRPPRSCEASFARRPECRAFFEECGRQLGWMKAAEFYPGHSYYDVLTTPRSRLRRLAKLARNKLFASSFSRRSYDDAFSCYGEDLRSNFEEAVRLRDDSRLVEERLRRLFGEYLPDVVVRNLAERLTSKDLPLAPVDEGIRTLTAEEQFLFFLVKFAVVAFFLAIVAGVLVRWVRSRD